MNNFKISDFTIEDLLPHRGHMLLIQEVLEADRAYAVTRCSPKPSWPMADEAGVPALILVEIAAQTAGVCNGWDKILSNGVESDKTGWLVGIKNAKFDIDVLSFQDTIISRAENTHIFANLREVHCQLHRNDVHIAEVTLQLFQAESS